jgi:DNA polymerase-3 subunit epsilon
MQKMNFVAIDVETANADMGSICQIGVAVFTNGQLVNEWCVLVDPEDYFDNVNISIHGIEPHMVEGQPTFPQIASRLRSALENTIAVCHTHFDRIAIGRAFSKNGLSPIETQWLDSARVVRRTWPEFAWKGYGLANVCRKIGYEFKHHDALEDAKAAGTVLLAALKESQQDLGYWCQRVTRPIDFTKVSSDEPVHRDGNPEGDLYGEILVFTGALEIPRAEAADLAAGVGCQVAPNVTKKTTILVVGDQDILKLAGHEKSSKHRRAEELVAAGSKIRIVCESDFKTLVNTGFK